ncbi:endospore germination permease [Paenibacillus sp. IB182496]|uniref:Endospore germination permease n=1 Tax=Paenibacillus sabuli TaxID=2772509 RepID=A0A927BTY5_9BACL|nr:endospore germination permease [Paenibacillus sabuli]MBD2845620.1 endospore germination permease [Paenibacillus sabuli]
MLDKGRIGLHQLTVLAILFTVGSSVLIAPSSLAYEAREDAWIAALLALVVGLLAVGLYNGLARLFPSATLVGMARLSLGRWLGGAVSWLYLGYFFMLSALVLRNIGDFMTTQVLPKTPIQFIHIFFLLVVVAGIRNGLEPFARAAEIFLPWVMLFFVTMVVLLPPEFHIENLQPVLGYGIKPVLRGTISLFSTPYTEVVLFLMIIPLVRKRDRSGKALLTGVLIGGLMLAIIALLSILVLGADLATKQAFPSYSLAKKISIGDFLERLEVVMAGIWFITIYFKLGLCFYASTMILGELTGASDVKPFYLPLGLSLLALSIVIYPNFAYFVTFASRVDFLYSLPFALGFPLLFWIGWLIRGRLG